mmetsp:Transcript_17518/g.50863  ORF Transcript_17518/g.50863 Transcript_17518/m.50863 type:complete len:232 (-) Transcript_17518:2131-2826(-)
MTSAPSRSSPFAHARSVASATAGSTLPPSTGIPSRSTPRTRATTSATCGATTRRCDPSCGPLTTPSSSAAARTARSMSGPSGTSSALARTSSRAANTPRARARRTRAQSSLWAQTRSSARSWEIRPRNMTSAPRLSRWCSATRAACSSQAWTRARCAASSSRSTASGPTPPFTAPPGPARCRKCGSATTTLSSSPSATTAASTCARSRTATGASAARSATRKASAGRRRCS